MSKENQRSHLEGEGWDGPPVWMTSAVCLSFTPSLPLLLHYTWLLAWTFFLVYPVMESFCKPEGRWKFFKPQKSIWLWNLSWGATEVKGFSHQKWHNDLFCIYLMLIANLKREKGGDGLTRKKGHWSEITWGSCSSVGCILTTYQTTRWL